MCLDAKMNFDDNAIFRQKEILEMRDLDEEDPTEVEATLKAVREKYSDKKVWCIFQPHQYQRTYFLFNNFIKALSETKIDKLIITDIYDVAGREKGDIKQKVSSEKLAKEIDKKWVIYLAQEKVKKYVEESIEEGDVVLVMGAGDVYKILDR